MSTATAKIPYDVFVTACRVGSRTNTGYPITDERNKATLKEMTAELQARGYSDEEMKKWYSVVNLALEVAAGTWEVK